MSRTCLAGDGAPGRPAGCVTLVAGAATADRCHTAVGPSSPSNGTTLTQSGIWCVVKIADNVAVFASCCSQAQDMFDDIVHSCMQDSCHADLASHSKFQRRA